MIFDPENPIVKLCVQALEHEGDGSDTALQLCRQAWSSATSDLERFTAAHYLARQQSGPAEKIVWDRTALDLALRIAQPGIQGTWPSLYLNVGRCYEELGDTTEALNHYRLAESYTEHLGEDGYGNMIRTGILAGLGRVSPGE